MASFRIIDKEITLNKEITELDNFVFDLISIVEQYCDYVIISGYVSIFFGRSRATEDVDVFINKCGIDDFNGLYQELTEKGYQLNEDDPERLYKEYLLKGSSINIWKKDFPLLRLEVKLGIKPSQKLQLKNRIKVKIGGITLYFSNIEAQIAYKRYIAKSDKDLEDARHLEIVFSDLDKDKIKYFRQLFIDENEE